MASDEEYVGFRVKTRKARWHRGFGISLLIRPWQKNSSVKGCFYFGGHGNAAFDRTMVTVGSYSRLLSKQIITITIDFRRNES